MCVRACVHIYYNTYTHRVARPFDVAAKAGTVRPASWDGMHRTQHKMPHSYTNKQIEQRREGGRDREREKILDRGKGKEGERLEGIFFFFFGLKVMGMRPFCKDDHGGIRRRGGKRSKCCSIKIKNYSLNSKLKWTAAATRKKRNCKSCN